MKTRPSVVIMVDSFYQSREQRNPFDAIHLLNLGSGGTWSIVDVSGLKVLNPSIPVQIKLKIHYLYQFPILPPLFPETQHDKQDDTLSLFLLQISSRVGALCVTLKLFTDVTSTKNEVPPRQIFSSAANFCKISPRDCFFDHFNLQPSVNFPPFPQNINLSSPSLLFISQILHFDDGKSLPLILLSFVFSRRQNEKQAKLIVIE